MKKHSMPEMKEGGVNVTPLIDIVMCLIIFFMLVAKIGVTTGAKPMPDLVTSVLGTKIEDMGNTLTLNVIKVPGGTQAQITALVKNEDKEMDHMQMVGVLKELKAANPNFKVIIRGESDLPFSMLAPVLIGCAEAGVKTVDFNTKKATEEVPG